MSRQVKQAAQNHASALALSRVWRILWELTESAGANSSWRISSGSAISIVSWKTKKKRKRKREKRSQSVWLIEAITHPETFPETGRRRLQLMRDVGQDTESGFWAEPLVISFQTKHMKTKNLNPGCRCPAAFPKTLARTCLRNDLKADAVSYASLVCKPVNYYHKQLHLHLQCAWWIYQLKFWPSELKLTELKIY